MTGTAFPLILAVSFTRNVLVPFVKPAPGTFVIAIVFPRFPGKTGMTEKGALPVRCMLGPDADV